MSTATQIEQLRATATRLRSVANKIGSSRAITVHGLAGTDTWVGPTPQACYDALLALRRQLLASQETLTDTARQLERRADALAEQPVVGLAS
jgi:hypothetical protein